MASKVFTTRIRHIDLTLSPFTSQQMMEIGQVTLDYKLSRIRQGINSQDAPAKPLSTVKGRNGLSYVDRKGIYGRGIGRMPIRNWTFRDVTLKSAKVKSASEEGFKLGFVDPKADKVISAQRRMSEQWSDSPKDKEVLQAIIKREMQEHSVIRVRKSA